MKKIIVFCLAFILLACGGDKKTIAIPNGLHWGMSVEEVERKGVKLEDKRMTQYGRTYIAAYRLGALDTTNSHVLGFNSNRLISYTIGNQYFPLLDESEWNDPTGEKAITLYNSLINDFDKKYHVEEDNSKTLKPVDGFWVNQSDESQLLSSKTYSDENTEVMVSISYNITNGERSGFVAIYYQIL